LRWCPLFGQRAEDLLRGIVLVFVGNEELAILWACSDTGAEG
jgi:hypothetical protein